MYNLSVEKYVCVYEKNEQSDTEKDVIVFQTKVN